MNRRKFFETAIKGGGALAVAALLPGMTGQVEDDGLWEVWADDFSADDFSAPFYVFLDGKDLGKTCTMFYGSKEPGVEVEGYVVVFSHDPPDWGPDGAEGGIATKRADGKVRWEVSDSYKDDPVRVAFGVSKPSSLTGEQEATDVGFYPDVVIYQRRLNPADDAHSHKVTGVGFEGGSHTFDITLGEHHTHLLDSDGDSHSR